MKDHTFCVECGAKNGRHLRHCQTKAQNKKTLVGYVHPLKGFRTVAEVEAEKETYEIANAFDQYANVFKTAKYAHTFVKAHRPGYVVVKVGRKYVPATPAFAKKMGLKAIKE
jgi:hypothetical protein